MMKRALQLLVAVGRVELLRDRTLHQERRRRVSPGLYPTYETTVFNAPRAARRS